MKISLAGIIICAACMFGVVSQYSSQLPEPSKQEREPSSNVVKFDAPPSIAGVSLDTSVGDDVEQIPTGTSTIPTFPKIIHLSSMSDSPASDEQEYQLIGLGIRTVSFLSIQVYVVGLYIAVPDIATLQERLMRVLDPIATTLVPGERSKLKEILLDPEKGEEVWNATLKDGNLRTAIRIVPTRNTDLQHLRDGFVRGITARTRHLDSIKAESFSDDAFGAAVAQFKAIWGGGARKNVPKGETLLMTRDAKGRMAAWVEDKKGDSVRLGAVDDERVSRLIWLGYLGGKTVSSEGARQSVVDGVVEFVERPVGTVATQVV
jgi:Chalcone isomerase like